MMAKLTKEEREIILQRFLDIDEKSSAFKGMGFSVRLALDGEFAEYAEKEGIANCVINFIGWLQQSGYAKRFAEVLNNGR